MDLETLSQYFSRSAVARGENYAASGRVQLLTTSATEITAAVRGDLVYATSLRRRGDELWLRCDCPFARDVGACKHLWALVLEAKQQQQLLPLLDGATSVSMEDLGNLRVAAPTGEASRPNTVPQWQRVLDSAAQRATHEAEDEDATWPADRRLIYLVDARASETSEGLVVQLATERQNPDGTWAPPKLLRGHTKEWLAIPEPTDRQIAQMLRGSGRYNAYSPAHEKAAAGFVIGRSAVDTTLRLLCETGRCRLRVESGDRPTEALYWDSGEPWRPTLHVTRQADGALRLDAVLERDGSEMALREPILLHACGILIANGAVARVDAHGSFALLTELRSSGPLEFPESEVAAVLARLYKLPNQPPISLPSGITVVESHPTPLPIVSVDVTGSRWMQNRRLSLAFAYDDVIVNVATPGSVIFDERTLRLIHRDAAAELRARQRLGELGAREEFDLHSATPRLFIASAQVPKCAAALVMDGWRVAVDGVARRRATGVSARVESSGVDWFELKGGVQFDHQEVALPEILQALRRGERTIVLADGSQGVLPEDLAARLAPLAAALGMAAGNRFRRTQTTLLDALLATRPEIDTDEAFERARAELHGFERVEAADAPPGFHGTLRGYQREGLGWLHFLRRFGLGGCLADDMGLGKTVQVLALLESRRAEDAGTALVVVPRSLVFNWHEEAARFAPQLRVLDHTGTQRTREMPDFSAYDMVLTTYGTLRRDAAELSEVEFDYVILDEAQAIKNSTTAGAKAARLLRARNRLALTGTPIENRLEELWSLFEFLNPGMLGPSSAFRALVKRGTDAAAVAEDGVNPTRALLARALRPVILRRTKSQVATELPERVEQTLVVELERAQRKTYDELLVHYRNTLLPKIARAGIARSRMHVLEALLRLRQAACHPALIDKTLTDAPSAKLDALVPMLVEAIEEEHKSLVFSQFTSFLGLLRKRLDEEGVTYAYLDGTTRDRRAPVARFQTEDDCRVFLISLKAGGQGLNLTAAEYVFLLDPWWNPAVEAQAIDRAHRIGQTRRVLATRLVAHDTIEERILELQQSKRDLADAILGEDQGLLSSIGVEELSLLLG